MNQSTARTHSQNAPHSSSLVLVVDDEPSICWAIERMLAPDGYEVVTHASAEDGLMFLQQFKPQLILLDVRLPGVSGIEALPQFIEASPDTPIILMTAFGDLETAVAAVQRGASDYITKPFSLEVAHSACRKALNSSPLKSTLAASPDRPAAKPQRLVGASASMQAVFKQIALVSQSDMAVLITGETGTGKELVAAAIHDNGPRKEFPYIPVALVALNPDLIESELFGHVQGAFTGAHRDKPGIFELAEGGTILLDELGDLPLGTQAKLLRVLEQQEYSRVGETAARRSNVRILAATNCDLQSAVADGTFRRDLFYRLNGLEIRLPPLRERTDDIEPLTEYFLELLGYPLLRPLDSELIGQLASRPWPGNIRELRNAIQHASLLARGRTLAIDDFPATEHTRATAAQAGGDLSAVLREAVSRWTLQRLADAEAPAAGLYEELLSQVEPVLFDLALKHTGGNLSKAAELLGLHRATLRQKMKSAQD